MFLFETLLLETPLRSHPEVALVDDDPGQLELLATVLVGEGIRVSRYLTGEALLDDLPQRLPDLFLLDLRLPGISGMELLAHMRDRYPKTPVILLTGEAEVTTAVEAMRGGAYDYLTKPVDRAHLVTTVRNALETSRLTRRVRKLERVASGAGYGGLVGRSPQMGDLFEELDRVAPSEVTVLIRGESGTGKELVARAIHANSGRSAGPFAAVNCAAIPEGLLESELFGHERGAFTGATAARSGLFERAHGGTLFLDELGDLPVQLQGGLLRAIQERSITRVGGAREIPVDFRLVVATHQDLEEMVAGGVFREDLFFRIAVFEVRIPPLRERPEDVRLLAEHFIRTQAPGREVQGLTRGALDALLAYPWPGNVRELENAIARALVTCGRQITADDLPRRIVEGAEVVARGVTGRPAEEASGGIPETLELEALERWAVEKAVARTEGNLTEAARLLGIGRTTLYRKLDRYGMR